MHGLTTKTVWFVALAIAIGGCADGAECDPGQVLARAVCIPDPAGASGAAGADGGGTAGEDGGTDSEGSAAECSVDFGTPCSDAVNHSDCGCPADFCGVAPGATTGYCTTTGCKEDPSLCPGGWTCVDFSVYDPTLPSVCVAPE